MKQEKRHKLQLFYEILYAIQNAMLCNEGLARPTRVQRYSRLSYDKLMIHFSELERKGMLQRDPSGFVSISVKGRMFIKHYEELTTFIEDSVPNIEADIYTKSITLAKSKSIPL